MNPHSDIIRMFNNCVKLSSLVRLTQWALLGGIDEHAEFWVKK